ncbi:MAG: response regulator transcription factor [Lachnospiraceae bacterium]|nr:response regulator transcription factor [Lachnospiraceae bacterium]
MNEIADKLFLSVATVKDYVKSLMTKTGFRTRTELAVRARELGLVIPE